MTKTISTALLSLLACAAAHAQSTSPSNTYLLLAAGQSQASIDCTGTTRCNETDTGFKIAGGWRFNDSTALELGYLGLGKASASFAGNPRLDLKSSAVTLGVAFGGEFSPGWSGVARLGVASVDTKATVSVPGLSVSDSDRTAQLHVGLGLAYAVSSTVSVEAGWDSTRAEFEGEKSTVNLYSLGVNFRF